MAITNAVKRWLSAGRNVPVYSMKEAREEVNETVNNIDMALQIAKSTYEEANESRRTIEKKATSVMGFSGVVITIVLIVLGQLGERVIGVPYSIRIAGAMLVIIAVIFLGMSILRSLQTLRIGTHSATYIIEPKTPFGIINSNNDDARRDFLVDLVYCTVNNQNVNNSKGTLLMSAQRYLSLGALTLVVILSLFVIFFLLTPSDIEGANSTLGITKIGDTR